MKQNWQQLIAAFVLGVMFPGLSLRLGLAIAKPRPVDPLPQASESISAEIPPQTIPVLTADGLVQSMDLEEYLVGVLLAEMPASFEEDALMAQAVVARTYALKRISESDRHIPGAVCTDPGCCQAYLLPQDYTGTAEDLAKITRCVAATCGQVLTYLGELAEATYFSCSGGRTESAVAVWGSDVPYLRSVESPGEEQAQPYTKTVQFTGEEFARALGQNLTGAPKTWLGSVSYTQGGGVATMVIGGVRYTGIQLRRLLKLNSTAFHIVAENNELIITTQGKGHRVGMSQYGADAMAASGSSYVQILAHYYRGAVLTQIEEN